MTPTETKACTARAAYMRAWQADRRARGLCIGCREPALPGKAYGPRCEAKRIKRARKLAKRPQDRQARRAAWAAVDWSRPTAEIAKAMDVGISAVIHRRIAAGVRVGRGRKRKVVDSSASQA